MFSYQWTWIQAEKLHTLAVVQYIFMMTFFQVQHTVNNDQNHKKYNHFYILWTFNTSNKFTQFKTTEFWFCSWLHMSSHLMFFRLTVLTSVSIHLANLQSTQKKRKAFIFRKQHFKICISRNYLIHLQDPFRYIYFGNHMLNLKKSLFHLWIIFWKHIRDRSHSFWGTLRTK